MEQKKVEIIRVCQLDIGDKFMWNGIWRYVYKKDKTHVHARTLTGDGSTTLIGSKSKQFVEAERILQ